MRRFSMTCLAFAAVFVALASTAGEEGGPRAVPVEPIVDFEIVSKGEMIRHAFEIKNEGTASLELIDVKPACGCTVAEFDRSIAPGKTGKVRVQVETMSFAGPIAKPISVFTNDPENPKLNLVVKANVKPYLGVEPGYARFLYVQGEVLVPISQVIWAADGADLEITDIKSPVDHISVSYRPAKEEERNEDQAGKQWAVDVKLAPQAPVGALRDYVEVFLNHPKQKSVRIPISGFVRPRQHVTPEEINFGVIDGSSLPFKRVATFTNFIADGIEFTEPKADVEWLSVVVSEVGQRDGHRFQLELTLGPGAPKGEFETTLKLHITDDQNPIVEVPVSGTIM